MWQPSAEFDLGQILPRRTHDSAVGDMIMPLPYVDTVISHPEENPYSLLSTPYSAGKARYAVLRGKRASIGKSDLAERNASRCARQIDSVASHRTMDTAEQHASDTVAVYKPPDVTWWPLMILAALALVLTAKHFLRK